MDFFNNIGKALSDVAKSVQQKTSSGIEIGRLSGEVRAQKAERARLISALGQTYFESRGKDGAQDQLALICKRIEEIDAQIKELSVQMDVINGQKRCPKCDNTVGLDVKFCPVCGTAVPTPQMPQKPESEPVREKPEPSEQPKVEYCVKCGAMRRDNGKFCVVCGAPFDAPADGKPAVEITWPEAESANEVVEPAADAEKTAETAADEGTENTDDPEKAEHTEPGGD